MENEVINYRMKKAAALVTSLKGKCTDQFFVRVQKLTRRVAVARECISLRDKGSDVTDVLKSLCQSVELMLNETNCACLRTFLFSMPKSRERALTEIESRLSVLEWLCNELSKQFPEHVSSSPITRAWKALTGGSAR